MREPAINSLSGRPTVNATSAGCASQPVYVRTRRASSRARALGTAAYPGGPVASGKDCGPVDYLRGLGATAVFGYHAADWAQQERAAVPGGVDLLLDCAGGQTRDQAIGALRDGGRVISIILQGLPTQLERGITGQSFAAHGGRERLEALSRLVDAGTLRPQVEAVLRLDQAREALTRVAGRHTRDKVVLRTGQS